MKKITALSLVSFIMLIYPFVVFGAISPVGHECWLRGYEYKSWIIEEVGEGWCVFPDGSYCAYDAFVKGTCGSEFKTKDYCIEKGKINLTHKCCEGLEPYLPPQGTNTTCQSNLNIYITEYLITPLAYLVSLLPIAIIIFGVFLLVKKNIQKNKKEKIFLTPNVQSSQKKY